MALTKDIANVAPAHSKIVSDMTQSTLHGGCPSKKGRQYYDQSISQVCVTIIQ